jgi:PilZ domain-containing protein
MQREIERRAAGVRRVVVERIVDVCATSAAPASAFQGRSVDVSGRGMSVRAAHLPELDAPIVVRFQEHGSEVIAEGVVAWRRETEQGSEFGVRFTALDSSSVQSLKDLCQASSLPSLILPRTEPEDGDTEPVPEASGSVKLHIGGLGAPLSARVRQQGDRRLSLGSSLDFLRVGRSVEIEDGSPGSRRGARIDEVDVAIDPDSLVPELIVSLRYESGTPLPQATSSRPPIGSSVSSADLFQVEAGPGPKEPAAKGPAPKEAARKEAAPKEPAPKEPALAASKESLVPKRTAAEEPAATTRSPRAPAAEPAPKDAAPVAKASVPAARSPISVVRRPVSVVRTPAGDATGVTATPASALRHDVGAKLERDDLACDEPDDELELGETDSSERPPPIIRRPNADTVRSRQAGSERPAAASSAADAEADEPEPPSLEIEETDAPTELERLRQRLDGVLDGLSSAARVTGERCRQLGDVASRGAGWVAIRARDASQSWMSAHRAATPTRRTSAAPRPSLRSAIARASARAPGRAEGGGARSLPRGTWLAAGFVVLAAIGAWRGRPSPSAPPAAPAASVQPAPAAPAAPSLPEPAPSPSPRPLVPSVDGDSEGSPEPETALAQAPLAGAAEPPSSMPEIIARPAARQSIEKRALARFAPAESSFDEPASPRRKPSGPVEFSSGRLELPIVHRLQLDRPGESVRGEPTPTGFDVVVVGRKALEPPTSIARRDARIAKATLRNGAEGARLSFRFRSTIPAYKVRLRQDYVEIFISSK